MKNLFLTCLNASVFGGVIILVGLLLRPLFRKVPRRILCTLWLLAAIRLLLPFNVESYFSLQPSHETFDEFVLEQQHQPGFIPPEVFPDSEVPDVDLKPEYPSDDVPIIPDDPAPAPETIPPSLDWMQVLSVVWMTGMTGILIYCVISYIVLKHQIRTAVQCEDGVMESEHISGAFLLGYLKPRIYLPEGLKEQDRAFVLAHERTHIQRLDHWWKLVGVLCVAIHWYNPLVWVGYALLCRDIEITCDERVIQSMDLQERKAYSQALLNSEKRRFGILECPVAFGEVDLKQRIRNVLAYHPYGYWLTACAVALVVFVGFCFLTSPITKAAQNPTMEIPVTQPTGTLATTPSVPETIVTTPTTTEPIHTTSPATRPPATKPPITEPSVPRPAVTVIAQNGDGAGNRTFRLTSDGTLTIYGNTQYTSLDKSLWSEHADMITKVIITEGCKYIEHEAFCDFENLTEVYLCESIETIDSDAFRGCTRLQYIRIPAKVTEIHSGAFSNCKGLTKVEFAENAQLTTIHSWAFANTAISSFVAPPNLTTIDFCAFMNCWRLKSVILKGKIQVVGGNAFSNCTRLEYVVLGESLTEVSGAFNDCGEIKTVENYSNIPF